MEHDLLAGFLAHVSSETRRVNEAGIGTFVLNTMSVDRGTSGGRTGAVAPRGLLMSVDVFGHALKTLPPQGNVEPEGWILLQYTGVCTVWQLACILLINKFTHRNWNEEEAGPSRLSMAAIYLWFWACPLICFWALKSTGNRILAGTAARTLEIDAEGVTFVRMYIALQVVGVCMEGGPLF